MFRACIALVLTGSAAVAAQRSVVPPKLEVDTFHLTATTSASMGTTSGQASLYVDVSPKPKMHVYAPGEKDAIPIEIKLDAHPAIKAGKPILPPPQTYFFPPLKLTQLVYSKPFRITLPITIARRPSTDTLTITGTLHYQACDDDVCYVPRTVAVKWTLAKN